MNALTKLALTTALCLTAAPAFAQSQGDLTFGIGLGSVIPKSSNITVTGVGTLDVEDNIRPTFTLEYFIRDNIGIELLAAVPFKHDITLGGATVGETKHLPPTLSINYHFPMENGAKPYIGAGLNYTTFFEESTVLGATSLDDSFGLALQVGLDYAANDNGWWRFNLRWIDIDSDITVGGAPAGTVEIDPIVVNVGYVYKF